MKIKMSKDVILFLLITAVHDFAEKVKQDFVENHDKYAQILRVFPDKDLLEFFLNYDAPCMTDSKFRSFLIKDNSLSPEIAGEFINIRHNYILEIEDIKNEYSRKLERYLCMYRDEVIDYNTIKAGINCVAKKHYKMHCLKQLEEDIGSLIQFFYKYSESFYYFENDLKKINNVYRPGDFADFI